MMLLKMLMAVLHIVNLQNTSLCCTTFTYINNTYSLIKILEVFVLIFTLLGIVCTVIVLYHLYMFILICFCLYWCKDYCYRVTTQLH